MANKACFVGHMLASYIQIIMAQPTYLRYLIGTLLFPYLL